MSVKSLSITEWDGPLMKALAFAALLTTAICVCGDISPLTAHSQWRLLCQSAGVGLPGGQVPNATGSQLVVSDQCRYFLFGVSYNGGSTHKENTESRRWQFKCKYRSKEKGPKTRLHLKLIAKRVIGNNVTQIFKMTTLKTAHVQLWGWKFS